MDDLTDDVIPEDTWVSLADILWQPKGTNKPKVTVTLLKKVIEAEGVGVLVEGGKVTPATDGDEKEFTSKARAYKLLGEYCSELIAYHNLPPRVHPDKDPYRWLEHGSPLVDFGWPKEHVPDFAEWVSKSPYSKNPPSTIKNNTSPNNLEVEPGQIVNADQNNSPISSNVTPDYDKELSDLFDPVPVEALEKMFSASGKWKGWAERAARNGLVAARKGRGMFNPYDAAVWFMGKGEAGWDLARCNRMLYKNIPARSLEQKHLLAGELE